MLKGLTRWNFLAVSDFHQLVEGSRCSSYLLGTKAWSWSVFPWIAAQRVLGRPGTKLDFKRHAVLAAVLLKFPTRNCRSWMLSFSSMPSPPAPQQYSCWAFAHFHSHCSDLDALFSSPLELSHTSVLIAVILTLFSVLLLSFRTLPFSLQWPWRCFQFIVAASEGCNLKLCLLITRSYSAEFSLCDFMDTVVSIMLSLTMAFMQVR